jgi:hypothetical protein
MTLAHADSDENNNNNILYYYDRSFSSFGMFLIHIIFSTGYYHTVLNSTPRSTGGETEDIR